MILVTGAAGQLGFDVVRELTRRGVANKGIDLPELDITDREAVVRYIKLHAPESVIHCAAYTAVDRAEDEADLCVRVNEDGTRNIALACREIDAEMIYISTDYLFDGTGEEPYEVDDPLNPLSVYGRSKLGGEMAARELLDKLYILRISWVFGENGKNFIKTMATLGRERSTVSVVCDQYGSPTYTPDLAILLADMALSGKYGTYHATNEGFCSWAELAEEVMRLCGFSCRVERIATEGYPTRAVRPKNSRLSKRSLDAAGFKRLPHWRDALREYFSKEKVRK